MRGFGWAISSTNLAKDSTARRGNQAHFAAFDHWATY
jgi:hypothetical protein